MGETMFTQNWSLNDASVDESGLSLSKAKYLWLVGDWEQLIKWSIDDVNCLASKADIALLIGSAHQQVGKVNESKKFIGQSLVWGGSKHAVAQVMISTAWSTLGGISSLMSRDGEDYFLRSLQGIVSDNLDLLAHTRCVRSMARFGLLPSALNMVSKDVDKHVTANQDGVGLKILKIEINLLNNELMLAQKRGQLFRLESDDASALERRSVSQLGQDVWVLESTSYKKNGFFVEFGATDGVILSNTYILERDYFWRGICAEPNPLFYNKLKENRSCSVSSACISGLTGQEVEFIFADVYGGMIKHVANDQHEEKRQAYIEAGNTAVIKTISLNDFLLEYEAPKDIDYLSIDTEGSEYEILKSFPFKDWNVKLLTIEHNYTKNRGKIRSLLVSEGYHCIERGWDDWYYK